MPRIVGRIAVEPIVNLDTGEVLVEAGERINRRQAEQIERAGIWSVVIEGRDGVPVKVIGNGSPDKDVKTIVPEDIVATINYIVCLLYDIGNVDDIDHLESSSQIRR